MTTTPGDPRPSYIPPDFTTIRMNDRTELIVPISSCAEIRREWEINIPRGFSLVSANWGPDYVVPEYMVPALEQFLAGQRTAERIDVKAAAGGPRPCPDEPFIELGKSAVRIPAVPLHSDREALSLHAQVLALQDRLGISYKDATHRLYTAEVARLEAEEHALKALESVLDRIDNTITQEIYPSINHIDQA